MNCGSRWSQECLRAHISTCKQEAKIAFKNEHTLVTYVFLVFLSLLFFSYVISQLQFPLFQFLPIPSLFLSLSKWIPLWFPLWKKKKSRLPRKTRPAWPGKIQSIWAQTLLPQLHVQPSRSKSVPNTGKRYRHPFTPIAGSPSKTRSYSTISYRQRI